MVSLPAPHEGLCGRRTHPDVECRCHLIRAVRRSIASQIRALDTLQREGGWTAVTRPLRPDAEFPTDLATDLEWAAMIAERSWYYGQDGIPRETEQ